ncbi:MAG: hypothetical protein RR322_03295 [Oscillospiraceae bacterium]
MYDVTNKFSNKDNSYIGEEPHNLYRGDLILGDTPIVFQEEKIRECEKEILIALNEAIFVKRLITNECYQKAKVLILMRG